MILLSEITGSRAKASPFAIGSRVSLLHVVVVSLSLLMTLGAWQISKQQMETRNAARFQLAVDRTLGVLETRIEKYEDALWSGVAAMDANGGHMTREEWRIFAASLRIDEKYPGINGIGVIHFLTPEQVPDYLSDRRAENPDFEIYPAHDQPVLMPISYIEPEAINAQAVGLDVAHEINRRTAALASRDSGSTQITGPIVLVQDAGSTPGFLYYAPFYEGGHPTEAADRQRRMIGAVYAPFVVRKLMEGLLAKDLRYVRFSIRDGGQTIYDEHHADDPSYDPDPMFRRNVTVDLHGRSWELDIRSNLDFRADSTFQQPTIILIGGLIIEALVIALLVLLTRANSSAVAYADRVSAELRREKEKLADTNQELEQFAYVTSHDLKTPIRGIGGLTEMLQEDLEDYLTSPNANPDVGENLQRILERVDRMNQLTQGVMQFSRIGEYASENTQLDLHEVVQTLASDLGLNSEQLELDTDIQYIEFDTFNLRRVLENLVSNALKYHEDSENIRILVRARDLGARCEFLVKDNGPGIDPRFHARVFDMFQTLQASDAANSTGIGLAIVKKSVERNGGAIMLNSSLGQGAEFKFDWPKEADICQNPNIKKAA